MIRPGARLLWAMALVGMPLCTLGGALPLLTLPCALALCLCFAVVAADAMRLTRQAQTWRVAGDSELQWFQGRTGTIPLELESEGKHQNELLVYLDLPPVLGPAEPVRQVQFHEKGRVEVVCTPQQRGRYQISQCFLSSQSPLKLWHNKIRRTVSISIRVYPDLRRDSTARMLLLRRSAGVRRLRLIGRGRDFERLRDYAPGDSFDEIYWKATARRSAPIVKVFQAERTQDIYVIVDSSRLSAKDNALEQFISAALTLALAAENEGDNFGLVTFSSRVDHFIRAAKGKVHFGRCRDALYDLSSSAVSPDFEDLLAALQLQVRRRSLLLFLTDLSDPILSEVFLRDALSLARKHLLLVNQLSDEESRPLFSGAAPSNLEEINERLAGHLQWAKLQDLQRSLRQKGITMHELKSGSASAELVQQYLQVKQKQIL